MEPKGYWSRISIKFIYSEKVTNFLQNLHRRFVLCSNVVLWPYLNIWTLILFLPLWSIWNNWISPEMAKNSRKVHIFWEGHNILRNIHQLFVGCTSSQIIGGDFAKFCGLLRICELYNYKIFLTPLCIDDIALIAGNVMEA